VRVAPPPLLPIFRSRLQGELLALILTSSEHRWTIDELARRTGEPYQTIATEVRRLHDSGILKVATVGRTKLLTPNEQSPYVRPLTDLVAIAFGPPIVIAEEFSTVDNVEEIYIYGSWAARFTGEPGPQPNDVDVLVIGRPDRDDVHDAAQRAHHRLAREVNVTQRTRDQWDVATDGFSSKVRSSPMVKVPYPHEP
jgi:predicted nucleotidyltransferase